MRRIRIGLVNWLLLLLLAACGGGGGAGNDPPPPAAGGAALAVTVVDTLGRFVAGAQVQAAGGGASASTDAAGQAVVELPTGGEQVLTVGKPGFAQQVRVLTLPAGAAHGALQVMLIEREPPLTLASIEAGASAVGKHGVSVEFPPDALVDDSGRPATGTITLSMTPVDVATSDIAAFPGLFEGTAPGVARGPIVSYGTAELVPEQAGRKLQLAAGKSATIELPLYVTTQADGTPIRPGDTIDLWSLDAATGLWQREGAGQVVARAASPTGLALRAAVTHFSWWNGDAFTLRALVNLTVRVVGAALPAGTAVPLSGQVVAGGGPTGAVSTSVILDTPTSLPVPAPSTMRFWTRFDRGNEVCQGEAVAAFAPQASVDVVVTANCVEVPTPAIVVPADPALTNSSAPTRVQVVLTGRQPDRVELLVDGQVVQAFGPQFFYVHLLDTATLAEGSHQLQARALLQGVSRDSTGVNLVIDRRGPQMTGTSPAASALVSRATTFSVTFDEPVRPGLGTLADMVKLTLTPAGQGAPVEMAATMQLDAARTTLTVTPGADLGAGTAALSWGGLVDAAGNAARGTVAVSWAVDRSTFLGDPLSHVQAALAFEQMPAAVALRADGSTLVAHRPVGGSAIVLSRFDAVSGQWAVVAPAINERPGWHMLSLAVGADDLPYVAFVQDSEADPAVKELVLKRLNGNLLEAAAPAVPLPGGQPNNISEGSMVVDPDGRPVIALADASLSTVRVFRLEQGQLVPLASLGALTSAPRLALLPDGTPLLAYLQGFGGTNATALAVVKLTGGAAQQVGAGLDFVPNASQRLGRPSIAVHGGEPWVAWDRSGATHLARFDGTQWVEPAFADPLPLSTALELAAWGDDLLFAIGDLLSQRVMRLHAGVWEEAFDASARASIRTHLGIAARGDQVRMIASGANGSTADVQRLVFP